ncbi:hypothetical protein GCM10022248_65380 [Nonomuraea soli]
MDEVGGADGPGDVTGDPDAVDEAGGDAGGDPGRVDDLAGADDLGGRVPDPPEPPELPGVGPVAVCSRVCSRSPSNASTSP